MAEIKGKILVTGAAGQIGSDLVPALKKKFGNEKVIGVDLIDFDATNKEKLEKCIKDNNVETVYHLVSLLSVKAEQDPDSAWNVNLLGLKTLLDLAILYKLKIFWPSSIAVFGPTTPRENTPQQTPLEPTTMYGLTKVAGELLGQYYFMKSGVDFRSVRFPGLLSWKTIPGGGTTDYACAIFESVRKNDVFECYLKPDTELPMMYMSDAIDAILKIMDADSEKLKIRTSYNLAAFSFTPEQLVQEIRKLTAIKIIYKPDNRQRIADSWPKSIDDNRAKKDWGWDPKINFPKMVQIMYEHG